MMQRRTMLALAAAASVVLARTAVFLLWEQSAYDSDQAIFGLMAKHIAEGRAFPVFIYGESYMLTVPSWLAAPLFVLFEPSAALLKVPAVMVNLATAMLLVWILIRDVGMAPAFAWLAASFFIIAPPVTAKLLIDAAEAVPEPFLYVLLLWVLRRRPVAFGAMFAIGFAHREFTAYAVVALVVVECLAHRTVSADRLKGATLAAVAFLLVLQLVRTAYAFSTPSGPGSTIDAMVSAAGPSAAIGRFCWAPASIAPSMRQLFGQFLGVGFGAATYPMLDFGVRSVLPMGAPWLWPILGSVLAVALVRVMWIAVRDGTRIWEGPSAFPALLILTGLQAGMVYAVARCGRFEPQTFRYAALTLYAGVGIAALYFVHERHRLYRRAMVAALLGWIATSVVSHARLLDEYLHRTPANPHRLLADALVARGVRYARADYWTSYATVFLAGERVIIASTDTTRIASYQEEVARHDDEAILLQRQPCGGDGIEIVPGRYWGCARR